MLFFLTLNINLAFDSSKLRYPMYKTVKLVCLFNGLMIGLGRKDEYSSLHAFLLVAFIWGGGTSTRNPSGMCNRHDMDSKVSLLVHEWGL